MFQNGANGMSTAPGSSHPTAILPQATSDKRQATSGKRPGKLPVRPDETLSERELEQRNKRRRRNKEASQSFRERHNSRFHELKIQKEAAGHEHAKVDKEIHDLRNKKIELRQILQRYEEL